MGVKDDRDDLNSWIINPQKKQKICFHFIPQENKEESRKLVKKIADRFHDRTSWATACDGNREKFTDCVKHKRFLWGYRRNKKCYWELYGGKKTRLTTDGFVSKGTTQPLTKQNVQKLVAALDFYCAKK